MTDEGPPLRARLTRAVRLGQKKLGNGPCDASVAIFERVDDFLCPFLDPGVVSIPSFRAIEFLVKAERRPVGRLPDVSHGALSANVAPDAQAAVLRLLFQDSLQRM